MQIACLCNRRADGEPCSIYWVWGLPFSPSYCLVYIDVIHILFFFWINVIKKSFIPGEKKRFIFLKWAQYAFNTCEASWLELFLWLRRPQRRVASSHPCYVCFFVFLRAVSSVLSALFTHSNPTTSPRRVQLALLVQQRPGCPSRTTFPRPKASSLSVETGHNWFQFRPRISAGTALLENRQLTLILSGFWSLSGPLLKKIPGSLPTKQFKWMSY